MVKLWLMCFFQICTIKEYLSFCLCSDLVAQCTDLYTWICAGHCLCSDQLEPGHSHGSLSTLELCGDLAPATTAGCHLWDNQQHNWTPASHLRWPSAALSPVLPSGHGPAIIRTHQGRQYLHCQMLPVPHLHVPCCPLHVLC